MNRVNRAAPSSTTTSTATRATALVLTLAAVVVIWPLWAPLVLAAWTAMIARPLLARTTRLLRGHERPAAALLCFALMLALAGPLTVLVVAVVSGAQELTASLLVAPSAQGALQELSGGALGVGEHFRLPTNMSDAVELARQYGAQAWALGTSIAGATSLALLSVLVYFAAVYTFLVDGKVVWQWLQEHAPLPLSLTHRLSAAFHETGRGLLLGVGLTTALQGLVATIVYLLLGVPRAWVLGPITGIASVIPVVGSALVWLPLSISFFLTNHVVKGIVMIVLGVGVISVVDNVARPLFTRLGALKMPLLLLFIALLGGLTVFGTWGAILGPLVVRLAMEALAVRKEAQA
jgi:predicted PurR-regulated permease PerM